MFEVYVKVECSNAQTFADKNLVVTSDVWLQKKQNKRIVKSTWNLCFFLSDISDYLSNTEYSCRHIGLGVIMRYLVPERWITTTWS